MQNIREVVERAYNSDEGIAIGMQWYERCEKEFRDIEEFKRLAEIGRAFEKALKEEYGFINFTRYAGAVPEKWEMKESEYNDVLDWAKASNKNNAI